MLETATFSLPSPEADIGELNDRLGQAWGITCGSTIPQYLAWSEAAGVFSLLASEGPMGLHDLCSKTPLNVSATDALLCILASLKLLFLDTNGNYALSPYAREFLVRGNRYYVGDGLFMDCKRDLPFGYLRHGVPAIVDEPLPVRHCSVGERLRIQHSRNFAPSVVAARSGHFDGIRHLVDIAGGSGVLAIPLALDRPSLQITLVEMPDIVEKVREFIQSYGPLDSIDVVGRDVLRDRWAFDVCDGVFFGNFFHACDDEECRLLARKSFELLAPKGRILLHEVLFNERRDGPLLAALWNANMVIRKTGARQRTAAELQGILREAGFEEFAIQSTAGGFSLVTGRRP